MRKVKPCSCVKWGFEDKENQTYFQDAADMSKQLSHTNSSTSKRPVWLFEVALNIAVATMG